jgi:hypothetical protein
MGRLFPDASLPTGDGHSLSLDSYRSRRALVIFMLGPGPVAAPVEQLLARLAEAHDAIAAEDGQVLVVIADAPARWYRAWRYPFPLAFDASAGLHRRVAAVDAAGRPEATLYNTDRCREIFAVLRPSSPRWPTSAQDVLEWLTFVAIQCPECNPPEE